MIKILRSEGGGGVGEGKMMMKILRSEGDRDEGQKYD